MTNASDSFLGSNEYLNYPLGANHLIGKVRGGRIVTDPVERVQTDINTKLPKYWDPETKMRPMTQLEFTVVCDGSGQARTNGWATDERVDAQDNGHRVVVIKGKDLTEACKGEIKAHSRPGLRIGDEYYQVWTGERPGKGGVGKARTWAVKLFPGFDQPADQNQFFGTQNAVVQGFQQAPPTPSAPIPNPAQPVTNPYGGFGQTAQQATAGFQQPTPAGPPPQFIPPTQAPSGPAGPAPNPGPAQGGFGAPQQAPPADNPWGQPSAPQQGAQTPWGPTP
ncbi:MAG TPA: hypothetical protein VK878_23265 [Candidatus Deferrimicrobiaceae bacterium]|nr:hypothetical protein [Candidatus Deferrimicrobiaceae bacterium]